MLKPAYLVQQRRAGTFSGVFQEDGSVWNLADARSVANLEDFHAAESPRSPS